MTTSKEFRAGWEEFLENCNVDKEPMIYQHITDETFTKLVEQSVKITVSEQNEEQNDKEPSLTYEEENTVSYVGGYVIHALMQKKVSQCCVEILKGFVNTNTDEVDKESIAEDEEWINSGVAKVGNGWAQAQPIMSSAQPIFI